VRRLGWKETDLSCRRKNDPGKLALAARLRRETTLSLKWITARVGLGSSKSANTKLHVWMRANAQCAVPKGKTRPEAGRGGGTVDSRKAIKSAPRMLWVDPFTNLNVVGCTVCFSRFCRRSLAYWGRKILSSGPYVQRLQLGLLWLLRLGQKPVR